MSETTHGPEDPVLEVAGRRLQGMVDSSSTSDSGFYLQQVSQAGLPVLDTLPSRPEAQQLAQIIAQQVDDAYNPLEERNLLLPVNRLPHEILESIFQECLWSTRLDAMSLRDVHKYGTGIHQQVLLPLALVSKRWYGIVFGTPSLWAVISITMPLALVDKGLNLSGSHHLDVYCETVQYQHSTGDGDVKASLLEFIEAVTPHLGRCRLIRIAFAGVWLPETQRMFASPNETIETLEMRRYWGRSQPVPDPITISLTPFQHQAPKLDRIKISGIHFDWCSLARFTALQTLELCHVTIKASQIESGFNKCLGLRVLELHNVLLDVNVIAPGPFLDLPTLQKLIYSHTLNSRRYEYGPLVISRFRSLRSLESIHLSVNSSYLCDDKAYFQRNVAPLSSDFSRILSSAACIHIDVDGFCTSINDTAGSVRLNFPDRLPDFFWHHFWDINFKNGFSGDIYLSMRDGAVSNVGEQHWKWPHLNVSRLTLTLEDEWYAGVSLPTGIPILTSLGGFLEDPNHWNTLRCIRFGFRIINLRQLTASLKKRYSGSQGSSVEPQHINIQIKCWDNGTSGLEELKAAHGVDSVILEERDRNSLPRPWYDEAESTRFQWDP